MKRLLSLLIIFSILTTALPVRIFAVAENPFVYYDELRSKSLKEAKKTDVHEPTPLKILTRSIPVSLSGKTSFDNFDSSILGERFIVKFKHSCSLKTIADTLSNVYFYPLAQSSERVFLVYLFDSEGFLSDNSELIEYLEADKIRSLANNTSDAGFDENGVNNAMEAIKSYVPADPLFNSQWEHKQFGVDKLWETTLGNADIIVAILDSGIDRNHEDLNYNNILSGYDAIARKSGVDSDLLGHGTSVTGVIAAAHNNLGGAGIAPDVTILPIRVTSEQDRIYSSDFMAALRFAADSGADIINMSFGGTEMSAAEQEAINYANSKGCILIAASGNDGNSIEYAGEYLYPASYDYVICVASLAVTGEVSSFSQFNDKVDIAAPGEDVLVLSANSEQKYIVDSGTSFSAPYVSGIAALLLSSLENNIKIDSGAFLSLLRISAGGGERDNYFGYGIISPQLIFENSKSPIVSGVFDGDIYFNPVTINFNRGTALLNGNRISNGYRLALNGNHELVVNDKGQSIKLNFTVDTMPLLFKAPAGDLFNEPISITFTRGTATLNGYPYYSGKKIETSGHYTFVLTGPNGNTAEKVFTLQTGIPSIDGVTDGAIYNTPVVVRQIGEGTLLINGVRLNPDKDHIISKDGRYTVTLSNFGSTNARTLSFTIRNNIKESDNIALINPKILLEERNKLAIIYSESIRGVRIYNYNDMSKVVKFISLDTPVNEAVFTDKYLVLSHKSSITLIERNKLNGTGTVPIYATINFDGEITGIENAGGLLYAIVSKSSSSSLYYINTDTKAIRKDASIPNGKLSSSFSNQTNRIYFWNTDGGDDLYYYNIQRATFHKYSLAKSLPKGDIACSDGYIFISGTVFQETDLDNSLARGSAYGNNTMILFKDKLIFSRNEVYNALTNKSYGLFKKNISDIAVASDNSVFVLFEDRTIEVYSNSSSPFSEQNIKYSFRLATAPTLVVDSGVLNSDFSTQVQTSSKFDLKDWVYLDNTSHICAIAEDDYYLYVFDKNMIQKRVFPLPMLPRTITSDGTRVFITFDASNFIYILNTLNMISTTQKFSHVINARHTEAHGGILYALSGSVIYSLNSSTGVTKTLPLGENSVTFTIDNHDSELLVSFYDNEDRLEVFDLKSFSFKGSYSFIASSSTLFCDGEFLYSDNLVFSCDNKQLAYAMPGKIRASNGKTVLIDRGVFSHENKKISASTTLFQKYKPLLTKNNEAYAYEKDKGFTLIHNPFGRTLGDVPTLKIEGKEDGKGGYLGDVKIIYDFGFGYHNGRRINSNTTIGDGGSHLITVVSPLGITISKTITITPILSSISIVGGDTYLNINESRTLKITYIPIGVPKLPVNFKSNRPDVVAVDNNGKITGIKEGVARITATTTDGKFSDYIDVSVMANDIKFNNNVFYLNSSGVVLVERAGTAASALISSVNKGNGSAVIYTGEKEVGANNILGTGNRLSVRNIYGEEVSSAYIAVIGDLNGDGFISTADYLELRKILSEGEPIGPILKSAADISQNNELNLTDLIMLESHLLSKAPLSSFDIKTLTTKDGNASITLINAAHKGSEIKVAISFENVFSAGINGAFRFDSKMINLISMHSNNDGLYLNYSLKDDEVYFNLYSEDGGKTDDLTFILTLSLEDSNNIGDMLNIIPLFLNSDTASVEIEGVEFEVLAPRANNNLLKELIIIGFENSFEFSPEIKEYQLDVPFSIDELKLIATPQDENALVELGSLSLEANSTTDICITVIAENGEVNEYIIQVWRKSNPSIIKSMENRLKSLTPSQGVLSPSFEPDIMEYNLTLPVDVYTVDFVFDTADSNAIAEYKLESSRKYIIECIAEDGSRRTYTINITAPLIPKTFSQWYETNKDLILYASLFAGILSIGIAIRLISSSKVRNFSKEDKKKK